MKKQKKDKMTPSRPYMLNAIWEWIMDNKLTPYIVVDASVNYVSVPEQYINKDGRIILNISESAARSLLINNDAVSFSARFSGLVHDIYIPMKAISAIYAKENGRGMSFPEDEYDDINPDPPPNNDGSGDGKGKGKGGKKGGRSHLKLVE